MKTIHLIFLLFFITHGFTQNNQLLLQMKPITDWSKYPIYPRLTENREGTTAWKKEYNYLDSIEVFAITYLSDGLKINGYLVKPKAKGNYPCIIYNRGGNRDFGALKAAHGAITLGQIARHGYIVVASQYRGNGGSEGKEEFGGRDLQDVLILPEVLKEVEGADVQRIGMYGWSRGGMMTYLALPHLPSLKAAAVGGALADMTTGDRPEMVTGVYAELIPEFAKAGDEALKNRSALYWPEKFPKTVPLLILHGNADWRVKASQSLQLALALDQQRVPYRLKIFEGGDHGLSEFNEEVNREVMAWFDRFLKNGEKLPNMEYHGD